MMAGSHVASRTGRFGAAVKERAMAAEKIADGNPMQVEPPEWLPTAAKDIWRENRPRIYAGCTESDTETFANFCIACATVRRCAKGRGPTAARELRAAQRVQLRTAEALGLTPSSRARLPHPKKPDPKNEREATIASLIK